MREKALKLLVGGARALGVGLSFSQATTTTQATTTQSSGGRDLGVQVPHLCVQRHLQACPLSLSFATLMSGDEEKVYPSQLGGGSTTQWRLAVALIAGQNSSSFRLQLPRARSGSVTGRSG
jgi:hypothetical protein